MAERTLLIACGALAHELVELQRRNQWEHTKIQCLPPMLHHMPAKIPGAVQETIEKYRDDYEHMFVVYADCGTSGELDRIIEKYGIERIPGAHCCEFFAGKSVFEGYSDAEPGTFYLTDFLVRHFDRLVVKGLGLDEHPELMELYFGNYKRVLYLVQKASEDLSRQARKHADYLGLEYMEHFTGLDPFESDVREQVIQWRN